MDRVRAAHALVKLAIAAGLRNSVRNADLDCRAFPDGMTAVTPGGDVFEPDVLVRSGTRLDPDATQVPDPLIVVEVVSPNSRARDTGAGSLVTSPCRRRGIPSSSSPRTAPSYTTPKRRT